MRNFIVIKLYYIIKLNFNIKQLIKQLIELNKSLRHENKRNK